MFGLGNIFSGLGNLFTMPNLLGALDALSSGFNLYSQINSFLNPPKMPDFARLDLQGNQPMPMPKGPSQQDMARLSASARTQMAERGVGPGGAFNNPIASMPGMFGDMSLYGGMFEDEGSPYGDY